MALLQLSCCSQLCTLSPRGCVAVPYSFCGSIFSLLSLCCYSHALAHARPGIVDSRLHGKSLPLAFLCFPAFLSFGGPIERLTGMHVQSLTVCSTYPYQRKDHSFSVLYKLYCIWKQVIGNLMKLCIYYSKDLWQPFAGFEGMARGEHSSRNFFINSLPS